VKNLSICLAVALLLRLGFVFLGFPALEPRWHLREDGDGYGEIAQSIREGRYDDVTRGPVYPGFVAMAVSPLAVKILQALLDTATGLLVWRLAGKRLWAAWLWAVYPFAIWRVAFINKEVVLTFLLAAYVLLQLRDKPLAAGLLLGLVNLCKPTFLLWPFLLLPFLPRRGWWTLPAMLLVIAPWTYRNWRVTGGEFLPVATEAGGLTTFVGNYQPTDGLWEGPGKPRWLAAVDEIKTQNTGASVVALDRAFYRAAWRQVTGHPLKALELVARKCGRFWFLSAARRERLLGIAIQGGYLALLGIGLWRARPWSREVIVMVALIGYGMLVHALSYADLRFSLPVMPLVCARAAGAFGKNTRAATG
jgi:hypothetical protein